MGKISSFFSQWGFTIFLIFVELTMLFALGCSIYTTVINAFFGSIGIVGSIISIAIVGWDIYKEIKSHRQ